MLVSRALTLALFVIALAPLAHPFRGSEARGDDLRPRMRPKDSTGSTARLRGKVAHFPEIGIPPGLRAMAIVVPDAGPASTGSASAVAEIEVEPDGSFDLPGIPSGRIRLVLRRRGMTVARGGLFQLGPGEVVEDVALCLTALHLVSGRVLGAGDRPVCTARVVATTHGQEPLVRLVTSTDEAGFFVLGLPDFLPVRLEASLPGAGSSETILDASPEGGITSASWREAVLRLGKGSSRATPPASQER